MRQRDKDIINTLHPKIRVAAMQGLTEANVALTGRAQVILTFGLRTFAEQQAIYDQGRTSPGEIVTKAKPGQSFHNYGLALDAGLLIDGKTLSWDTQKDFDMDHVPDWMEMVTVFKKHGFAWGGDWKSFKDMPHFEMTFGYTWQKLHTLYMLGKFLPATNYLDI